MTKRPTIPCIHTNTSPKSRLCTAGIQLKMERPPTNNNYHIGNFVEGGCSIQDTRCICKNSSPPTQKNYIPINLILAHFQNVFSSPHYSLFICTATNGFGDNKISKCNANTFTLVVDFHWLLKCVTILISCISPFRSIVRVLQSQILLPSTINISSLKPTGDYVSVMKILWSTQ